MDRTEAHGGTDAREVEAAMKTVNEILPGEDSIPAFRL